MPRRGIGVRVIPSRGESWGVVQVTRQAAVLLAPSVQEPTGPLGTPVETALGRVLKIYAQPSEPAIVEAFSPTFIKNVPMDRLLDTFKALKDQFGACAKAQTVRV